MYFEAQWTSFRMTPSLSGLDRAEQSYDPGSVAKPKNFALTLFGVQIRYICDVKYIFQVFLGSSIRCYQKNFGPGHTRVVQSRPQS